MNPFFPSPQHQRLKGALVLLTNALGSRLGVLQAGTLGLRPMANRADLEVTIGQTCRTLQRLHRRQFLLWLKQFFQAGLTC